MDLPVLLQAAGVAGTLNCVFVTMPLFVHIIFFLYASTLCMHAMSLMSLSDSSFCTFGSNDHATPRIPQ